MHFPSVFASQDITRDLHVHVHLDYMFFENHEEKRGRGGAQTQNNFHHRMVICDLSTFKI